MYRLSIDVGGTFTDLTAVDDDGVVAEAKVSSSGDIASAMGHGLTLLARNMGLDMEELLSRVPLVVHGTTVAINTLLQSQGPVTALLCTDGFRDSTETRLGFREKRYDFTYPAPAPLVPRYLRVPVRERMDKNGQVFIPLQTEDVVRAAEAFREQSVEAVAVSFLWSFLNPSHEREARTILRERLPQAHVSLSSEVCPEIREYDRASSTAVNAYISQALVAHLESFEGFLRSAGYRGEIRYLQSNGGLADARAVNDRAINALFSGPAAGPCSGRFFASALGYQDSITADMGGTSFDVCVLTGGEPQLRDVSEPGGYRVRCPTIDVQSIGAGGGSIAWVDRGLLRVGPRSAEAVPGPACYGTGGTEPTVTDADMVLGYLNPGALLGGALTIQPDLSREAIHRHVAGPLGIEVEEAAAGIFDLANRNMADAIRRMTLQRGLDPRDYTLVVGGGAGPVHAGSLAQMVGITRVIIPRSAAEFCSFGGLISDLRLDFRRTCASQLDTLDLARLESLFQEMEHLAEEELRREGAPASETTTARFLDMRYKDQLNELRVDVTCLSLTEANRAEVASRFHRAFLQAHHYSQPGQVCEVINARVTAVGETPPVSLRPVEESAAPPLEARLYERPMLFTEASDLRPAPVYRGPGLLAGQVVHGPAVVEEPYTTIVVFPGWRLDVARQPVYQMVYTGNE